MNFYIELGHRIKFLRHLRNMTQREVADRVGVSRVSISHWEIGQYPVSAEHIAQLAKIFDVSSDYILGLKEGRVR